MDEPFSNDIDDKDFEQNNKKSSCSIIVVLIIIIGILTLGIVGMVILYLLKKPNNNIPNNNIPDNGQDNGEEIIGNRIIKFEQPKETAPAKHIIVHIPEKEIFMSTLHPGASLYEDVTNDIEVKKCFKELKSFLKEKNIELITVRSALKLNKKALKQLASEALTYKYIEENDDKEKFDSKSYTQFLEQIKDEYKNTVLDKLSEDQLVDVVLNNPTYELRPTNSNTFIEPISIKFNPLGNLVFCRDQQITTKKGVVIGRARSSQRAGEHKIMEQVFKNINATIIGNALKGGNNSYLEGGDYFVAKEDLSMLGVGLRTSLDGAKYLMENDLLGTKFLAIIYDYEDLDQQRMHLDTYFNFLSDNYVIVLDFDEVQKHYNDKKIERKVFLYEKQASDTINDTLIEVNGTNITDIPKEFGEYKLVSVYQKFYDFLEDNGYKMIKVTHQQQVDYIINFLNIGNGEILSVTKDLMKVAEPSGTKIKYFEFKAILNMYGATHCITQVSRVD